MGVIGTGVAFACHRLFLDLQLKPYLVNGVRDGGFASDSKLIISLSRAKMHVVPNTAFVQTLRLLQMTDTGFCPVLSLYRRLTINGEFPLEGGDQILVIANESLNLNMGVDRLTMNGEFPLEGGDQILVIASPMEFK